MRADDGITDDVSVEAESGVEVPEAFGIRDHRSANWLVRRVLAARQYAAQVRRFAETELKRAQREEEFLLARYGAQLEQWTIHEITVSGGRRRFVALPAGRVCIRRVPAWLDITDEPNTIDWCRKRLPSALLTIERLRRTELRQHVETTGEVPDGVAVRGETQRVLIQDLTKNSADFLKGVEPDGAEEESSQQ